MTRRTLRISAQLQDELARLLREETTDPRVRLVTLTRVDVAPDLSHAIVFFSIMDAEADDTERVEEAEAGLDSAAAFLRRRVAARLSLKRTPELRFRFDPSLSLGSRVLHLLDSLSPTPNGDDEMPRDTEPRPDDGETP